MEADNFRTFFRKPFVHSSDKMQQPGSHFQQYALANKLELLILPMRLY